MAQTAFRDNNLLIAADITGAREWERVRKWSADGELVTVCCRSRAVAVENENGFRFFRHYRDPKNCEGGKESVEHDRLKATAYMVAKRCGYLAEMEASGPGWRADVLVTHPTTGKQSAIEIQKSDQKNHETRDRVGKHHASGVRSIWFFLKKKDYHEVPPDLMAEGLPAFVLRKTDIEGKIDELSGLLTALLKGTMIFDRGVGLDQVPLGLVGYNYPCGKCQQIWYRTTFSVAYPNRIRGGLDPVAIYMSTLTMPETLMAEVAQRIGTPLGRLRRPSDGGTAILVCPHCGTMPDAEFLTEAIVVQCPHSELVGSLDFRARSKFKPGWRKPPAAQPERVMDAQTWARITQEGIADIQAYRAQREQEREAQRRFYEDQERLRQERLKSKLRKRETDTIFAKLSPLMAEKQLHAWFYESNPSLEGSSPYAAIEAHVERHWNDAAPVQSEPARQLSAIEEGGRQNIDNMLGLTEFQQLCLRRNYRHEQRISRIEAAEGIGGKTVAVLALHIGDMIDKVLLRPKAK